MNTPSRRTPPRQRPGARALRAAPPQPFLQRNRTRLLWGLAAVALVAMGGLAFFNATSPVYACGTQWTPAPTPSAEPGASPRLGYVETDLGRNHVAVGTFVKYALCPPASGDHYNQSGEGPIKAQVYGPDDQAIPQGWVHNLEHGAMVLLYRCTGSDTACSDSGQAALKDLFQTFPNSPICNLPPGSVGPVIARFDQMQWPYAAMVWGVVLPLNTLDVNEIKAFFAQQGERTNPEPLCAAPTATPGPSGSPAASTSPTGSAAPTNTAAPTAAPTTVPTATPAPAAG